MKAKRKKGEGSVYQRGAVWWIKYSRDGKPYAESSRSTKERGARKLLKKRLGEIVSGRFVGPDADKVRVRELAEDYVNDYRVNGRKSLDKAERMVRRFDDDDREKDSELLAYFGDCKAHNVGTDAIKKYIALRDWRKARQMRASTASWPRSRECTALAFKPRKSTDGPISLCSRKTTCDGDSLNTASSWRLKTLFLNTSSR